MESLSFQNEPLSANNPTHVYNDKEAAFTWTNLVTRIVMVIAVLYPIAFVILEVSELVMVINNLSNVRIVKSASDILETFYMGLASWLMIKYAKYFIMNSNGFSKTTFINNPMFIAMVPCCLSTISYYIISFITLITKKFHYTILFPIFAIISEFMFCVVILPFVIICVHFNIIPNGKNVRNVTTTSILSILSAMGGCIVVLIQGVSMKMQKEVIPNRNITEGQYSFIHRRMSDAKEVFVMVDITYVVLCLIFLFDPLWKFKPIKRLPKNITKTEVAQSDYSKFITNITLVKNRLFSILPSVALVTLLLVGAHLVAEVFESGSSYEDKIYYQSILIGYFVATHILGLIICIIYYSSYIHAWSPKKTVYAKHDSYFNYISSIGHIIYASIMFIVCISTFEREKGIRILVLQLLQLLFMGLQVGGQAVCIYSAIQRQVINNIVLSWKSNLFPPLLLASLNFGYMVINVGFMECDTFFLSMSLNSTIFYIVKGIFFPIAIINRLHAMTFFIRLSIQQWDERLDRTSGKESSA